MPRQLTASNAAQFTAFLGGAAARANAQPRTVPTKLAKCLHRHWLKGWDLNNQRISRHVAEINKQ